MDDWLIYRASASPTTGSTQLPPPPPWRDFDGEPLPDPAPPLDSSSTRRLGAQRRRPLPAQDAEALELVNAALYLRRPLLVTGEPGTGKSTLAHAVAYELGLGRVLQLAIVSRTALSDGLYHVRRHRPAPGRPDCRRPAAAAPTPGAASAATSGSGRSAPRCCPPSGPGCCSSTSSTRATSTCRTTC